MAVMVRCLMRLALEAEIIILLACSITAGATISYTIERRQLEAEMQGTIQALIAMPMRQLAEVEL